MHIIFKNIAYWQTPILRVLRYFKFNIYYLYVDANSAIKKNKIASKLKKINVFPLPIEFEKNILPKTEYSFKRHDPDEFTYSYNLRLMPDSFLDKYCNLFSIDKKRKKVLRLLFQEFIAAEPLAIVSILWMWSSLYPKKKIIYVSFSFKCFFIPKTDRSILKIILPINIFSYFVKFFNFKNLFLYFFSSSKIDDKQENQVSNRRTFDEIEKKSIAFVIHKGNLYGTKGEVLFEKLLYYSDDINSYLNKYNILHLDYENYPSPEQNLTWVCLNKLKISNTKIFFKTLFACVKTFYLIRNWSTFLGWLLCMHKYKTYIKYCEVIKKFKNLKIAIIDYDILCPKTLILALEKNNIRTFATQERFISAFFNSIGGVILDTYYVASQFIADHIKKSKYYDVKNIIPVGQYRSDYITSSKTKSIPEEISKAKEEGKKIIVAFGYHTLDHWFESYVDPIKNWTSHINFLEDMIKLSQQLNGIFLILRFKSLDHWVTNSNFKSILEKLNNCENIIISKNFTPLHAYRLCAHADLVIAKHTSIADECLSKEIPVLFHEYTHNVQKIMSHTFDYSQSNLLCHSYDDLFTKSQSLLFDKNSKLVDEVKAHNNKFYKTEHKGKVKDIIIQNFEENLKYNY